MPKFQVKRVRTITTYGNIRSTTLEDASVELHKLDKYLFANETALLVCDEDILRSYECVCNGYDNERNNHIPCYHEAHGTATHYVKTGDVVHLDWQSMIAPKGWKYNDMCGDCARAQKVTLNCNA